MQARRGLARGYAGRLTRKEETLAGYILNEIAVRGPLSSDEIYHDGVAKTAWGTHGREVKIVLEKLFVHGRVLITQRRKFRRIYDLPEQVLPTEIREQPIPDEVTSARWLAQCRFRQRRLAAIPRKELPLIEDLVEGIKVEGCSLPLYCLREDVPLIEPSQSAIRTTAPRLIAPLDPLIYDRKLTKQLWNFEYTWEVYTPQAKRIRGYYALPLLDGDAIVGHIDPKADREVGRLKVINRKVARGHRHGPAVRQLANFLGLR